MSLHVRFDDVAMPVLEAGNITKPVASKNVTGRTSSILMLPKIDVSTIGILAPLRWYERSVCAPLPCTPPPAPAVAKATPIPMTSTSSPTTPVPTKDTEVRVDTTGGSPPPKKKTRKGAFKVRGRGLLDPRDQQLETLEKLGDPLIFLRTKIDWESFRPELAPIYEERQQGAAGRKPLDPVLMFKIVILQRINNLSDDQAEYLIRDRASFQRFLGLEVEDGSPDAKTIWLFKERIKALGLERDLFFRFDAFLEEQGFAAKGGQLIDATFVQVPRQRNTREENETIKAGNIPEGWDNPHMLAQKDLDAEWTKKNEESFYGYKDHTNVDQEHKLIRDYTVTGASVHDSRMTFDILDTETKIQNETGDLIGRPLYADSAYRSKECEEQLLGLNVPSFVHERPYKNKPLSEEQKKKNHEKSKVRVRVEHIYGCFQTSMNRATFIRTIGSARACMMIGLMNLSYNMLRFLQLTKSAPAHG
jgi:IS5 family transposase